VKQQAQELFRQFNISLSDSLISRIIEKIQPEVDKWQNRGLESIYPIVYMDVMVFKIKDCYRFDTAPYFV